MRLLDVYFNSLWVTGVRNTILFTLVVIALGKLDKNTTKNPKICCCFWSERKTEEEDGGRTQRLNLHGTKIAHQFFIKIELKMYSICLIAK